MHELGFLAPSPRLAGNWCRASLLSSSVLEAVSFVTPTLESFFMRTVAQVAATQAPGGARNLARIFIREEASHSASHRRLNDALRQHLGGVPPGLDAIDALLDWTERHMSLHARLVLVDFMERGSEVLSRAYLDREAAWSFECAFARRLFALHASEELRHGGFIAELWGPERGQGKLLAFIICAWATIGFGAAYLTLSVPWIMLRKRNGRPGRERNAS